MKRIVIRLACVFTGPMNIVDRVVRSVHNMLFAMEESVVFVNLMKRYVERALIEVALTWECPNNIAERADVRGQAPRVPMVKSARMASVYPAAEWMSIATLVTSVGRVNVFPVRVIRCATKRL